MAEERRPTSRKRWPRRFAIGVGVVLVVVAGVYVWAWTSTDTSLYARALIWMQADIIEALAIKRCVDVGVRQQTPEPLQLQRLNLGGAQPLSPFQFLPFPKDRPPDGPRPGFPRHLV